MKAPPPPCPQSYRRPRLERGGRKGWKTFFRLDAVGGSTTITSRAVWIPHSFVAWLRGRLIEKRKGQRQLEQILKNLQSVLAR